MLEFNATLLAQIVDFLLLIDAAALKSRLEIKGGLIEYLNESGISVKVQVKDNVMIPAFTGAVDFEYAKPVQKD